MSLYGALMTGVTGLSANSKALSIASSNIANVNTIGYKTSEAAFSTLLASAVRAGQVGSSGVTTSSQQNISEQGLISSTSASTDLALSGNGFFVVSKDSSGSSGQNYYTRAGDFRPDGSGNLRNSAGYYLMGWQLDTNGAVPSDRNALVPVNVSALAGKATPTSNMAFKANLQATTDVKAGYVAGDMYSGTVAPDFQRTVNVYDSQGGAQPVQLSFVKTGANLWSYEVTYQGDAANIGGATNNPIYSGTMSFNEDGTLANANTSAATPTGSVSITLPWDTAASGLSPQTVKLDLGNVGGSSGITQFSSPSLLISSRVDGALFGSISGVTIDTEGYVTAQFTNGLTQRVYKVPVALFSNPDGLTSSSGNAYSASEESGNATISEADSGGAGSIQSSALESSTVDLAHEFTNLITTQRAYSASARIITTASEMLDQLLQMGR